jgi:FecR protein
MRSTAVLLPLLFVSLSVVPIVPQQAKADEEYEPQMVWITHAEGQVKFSPGQDGEPRLGKAWLDANSGQDLEDGYTLATEKGRAEIEFENGAVVYLAEGSVLEFNRLRVNPWQTETQLSLLTGTATIAHVIGQDPIRIATPTENFRFTGTETARLESTLDGAVIHSVSGVVAPIVEGEPTKDFLDPGTTSAIVDGRLVPIKDAATNTEDVAWDEWVSARLAERRALINRGMKEMELREPIPGLAGMMENGKVSDCAPYGKCWEPNDIAAQTQGAAPAGAPSVPPQAASNTGPSKKRTVINNALLVRCPMEAWLATTTPGAPIVLGTCFYGTWDHHRWVAQHRHHHPCYFVKTKNGIGFVPKHPADEKGKPPVNAKSGVFVLATVKGQIHATVEPAPANGVHVIENPHVSFERAGLHGASRVAPPVIQAKLNADVIPHEVLSAAHTNNPKAANVTNIHFNYKSNSFVGSNGAIGSAQTQVVAHLNAGLGGSGHAAGGAGGQGAHGSSGGGGSGGGHSGSSSASGSSGSSSSASASAGGGHH